MFDEQRFYDRLQHDFPILARPYQCAAQALDLTEHAVLSVLARDLGAGRISRIGAVFAPNVIGASTLAALAVPAADLPRVAALVNTFGEVSHNYARTGHHYNLWFVAGARDRDDLDAVLAEIGEEVGQTPLDLPLEREYHIDLGFPLTGRTRARRAATSPRAQELDDDDWRLVTALEAGLPLTPQPYHALALHCGLPLQRVLARIGDWHASGVIRRFGAILHHRRFGYGHNAMCVWNVPDGRADAIGTRLARLAPVSLCYRRTRRAPHWPYNLFAMVHARSAEELRTALELFHRQAGLAAMPGVVLRSSKCFKQRGTRYGVAPLLS